MSSDLLLADSHFAFGENWTDFLKVVDEDRVSLAVEGMRRLFPDDELRGARLLDIGCGSGLSALAAAHLGVASITAVDIDRNSVSATSRLLGENLPKARWSADVVSVFDLPAGQFDVVHSWGVLHHTGDMWRAIRAASEQVKPRGLLALAIYRKTPLCGAWKVEKAIYSKAPRFIQAAMRALYLAGFTVVSLLRGKDPFKYRREYGSARGMSFMHDVHDWLGGYPYESAAPAEIRAFLADLGFELVRERLLPANARGVLGSGCDEYVFRRSCEGRTGVG